MVPMTAPSAPRIALVAALHEELASVLALMPDEHKETLGGRDFWVGHLHGQEVVAALCGIGKVAAATTATILIQHFGVDRIVFTGVAGGLGPGVKVGDVVVARTLLQHDYDVSPIFPRYVIPGHGVSEFPADTLLTDQLFSACATVLGELPKHVDAASIAKFGLHQPTLHQGLVISGDRFVCTTPESEKLIRDLPKALAVEMEGAAFAQVCKDFNVPLAVVRTISDRADDEAHVDFPSFLQEVASKYSGAIIETMFNA
jgi:adenosylhomocysteine nucleosidase